MLSLFDCSAPSIYRWVGLPTEAQKIFESYGPCYAFEGSSICLDGCDSSICRDGRPVRNYLHFYLPTSPHIYVCLDGRGDMDHFVQERGWLKFAGFPPLDGFNGLPELLSDGDPASVAAFGLEAISEHERRQLLDSDTFEDAQWTRLVQAGGRPAMLIAYRIVRKYIQMTRQNHILFP